MFSRNSHIAKSGQNISGKTSENHLMNIQKTTVVSASASQEEGCEKDIYLV